MRTQHLKTTASTKPAIRPTHTGRGSLLREVPLLVRDQTTYAPSGPVAVPTVKVVFMLSGWARVRSTSGEALLEAGSVLTIPASLRCWGFPAGSARTVTLYVQPEFLADQMRWVPAAHPLVHHLHLALDGDPGLQSLQLAAASVQELAPLLARLARPPDSGVGDFALLGGVAEVFDALGRLAGAPSASAEAAGALPRREVLAALSLLRSDLSAPWRIETLARAISLSPSQLTRLFRTQVGVSPSAFLNQLRADRMAELLASTSLMIGEAGAAVGWPDPAVASRSFKQRYGVAPSTYASFHRSPRLFQADAPIPSR